MRAIFWICLCLLPLCSLAEPSEINKYQTILDRISPQTYTVTAVNPTPLEEIHQLTVKSQQGTQVFFMNSSGDFLFDGNLVNLSTRENLTEHARQQVRADILKKITQAQRLNFFPPNMTHQVTVFTDIDCGYCRKLHSEMAEYHARGIGISYLFFPRAGLSSPSYDKAVAVWCSDDPQQAMNKSQLGQQLDQISCDNPIKTHWQAVIDSGLAQYGTPSIVTGDGQLIRGYVPADALKQRLMQSATE